MSNSYILFLFPISKKYWPKIKKIINKYNIEIINKKKIYLSEIGKFNLINNLYIKEKWLGNKKNNYDGLYYKLNSCFNHEDNNILIYYVKSNSSTIKKLKKEIRDLCNVENHSIHTTDTKKEYNYLTHIYSNDNTIKFLNVINTVHKKNFKNLFNKFNKHIKKHNIEIDKICLSGSSVLSVFNLRDCYDIDYLTINDKTDKIDKKIDSYNEHYLSSKYYKKSKLSIEQIINNDKNFFYYNEIKFMSLELLRKFKKNRNEEKDKNDILLIDTVLNNENYRCK